MTEIAKAMLKRMRELTEEPKEVNKMMPKRMEPNTYSFPARIPNDIVDAFDGGWLNDKELSTLCEDVIHELNARGLLVWPCIALNDDKEQIVIIDTEEELWKEVHERAQREGDKND